MKDFVSVILPAYNASYYLKNAVLSVLNQTFKNFELIIIDDGSTDGCCDFLSTIKDERIKFIKHDSNRGLIYALNEGITRSGGEYIIRMDADDFSYPNRFSILVDYMKKNPHVGIAGSYTNHTGKTLYHTKHLTSDEIKARLLFDNIYSHPTMIFRKSVFTDNGIFYNNKDIHAEDYGLWMELLEKTEYGIIPIPLLNYGIHHNQISNIYRNKQMETVGIIHRRLFDKMNVKINEDEAYLHEKIFFKNYEIGIDFLKNAEQWLLKLRKVNEISEIFHKISFNNITSWVWFEIATHLVSQRVCNSGIFRSSPLYEPNVYNKRLLLKYGIKSLFCL